MNSQQPSNLAGRTTEGRNPASANLDSLSALEIVELINSEDAKVAEAVGTQAAPIAEVIEAIANQIPQGGRLIYVGAGTSGRLGVLDASECPPTFSTPPELVVGVIAGGQKALTRAVEGAEDFPEQGRDDLQRVGCSKRDVVVGIATSGRTPYVVGALQYAQHLGAFTVGLSCNEDCELRENSQVMIVAVVGPEVVTGSTRMKAGTATKMILNMLTTGAMVRMGKTFGNLMVDLRATNQKLTERSSRIVAELTGLDWKQAEQLLKAANGELKTAIVSHCCSIEPADARQRLAKSGGHLRQALGDELRDAT